MNTSKTARLILDDGSEYKGYIFGYPQSACGELVFSTAMTGYAESLTDPSYKGQILLSTYPLIGNYGIPPHQFHQDIFYNFESEKIHPTAFIISENPDDYSHHTAASGLSQWLYKKKIPGLFGVDTRALTKKLRAKGSMGSQIVYDKTMAYHPPFEENPVLSVTTSKKRVYGKGKYTVLLIDCGVKYAIIRSLLERGLQVVQVPFDTDLKKEKYDGILISNGPGDPIRNKATIAQIEMALEKDAPIMGICLGAQLLALAAKASTYKLPYGHRGHNQPVIIKGSHRCFITSQNHGYAIAEKTLKTQWEPYFINTNDQTIEGIRHQSKPFFGIQFHPEASGGPRDTTFLFDDFTRLVKAYHLRRALPDPQ